MGRGNLARTRKRLLSLDGYRETYFRDTIYFPVPTGGLDGVLTLRIDVEGAEPVEVRFTVPEIGHKKDHDHSGHDHD